MSTISSNGLPDAQNPNPNPNPAVQNPAMNSEWAILKNEIKQLKKQVTVTYFFLATLVVITAVILASLSLSYVSPKDCFATGRGLKMAVVGEQANAVLHIYLIYGNDTLYKTRRWYVNLCLNEVGGKTIVR
jgi:hypothetical protein